MTREELYTDLKTRFDGMDAWARKQPVKPGGVLTGDNVAISVPVDTMREALAIVDPDRKEPAWDLLRKGVADGGALRRHDFNGAHVKALVGALAPAGKLTKEG